MISVANQLRRFQKYEAIIYFTPLSLHLREKALEDYRTMLRETELVYCISSVWQWEKQPLMQNVLHKVIRLYWKDLLGCVGEQVKRFVDYHYQVKLTTVANLEKLTFRAFALRRSPRWSRVQERLTIETSASPNLQRRKRKTFHFKVDIDQF